MKTFTIRTDTHYGWYTGITKDGELAIVDVYDDLFFDAEGRFLRIDHYCDWHDYSKEMEIAFKSRLHKILAIQCPIEILPFEVDGFQISLRQLPKNYELYLKEPASSTVDTQNFIKEWLRDGRFEFRFHNDFWMSADGTVNSS